VTLILVRVSLKVKPLLAKQNPKCPTILDFVWQRIFPKYPSLFSGKDEQKEKIGKNI